MRVSIVTQDGTTTYSENIAALSPSTEDFSTILDETTATNQSTGNIVDGKLDTSKLSGVYSLEDIFNEAASTYQVDVNLLKAIAKQESNFHADATSSSGAQGIMQLMPATAQGLEVTDAYDPYQNIMGGAKYIKKLLDQYNGDVSLALAAYNAGSGNVAKYGGIPPFEETQNYVKKVTAYYAEGVEVPDTIYTSSSLSKSEAATNLETLLSDFTSHESYPDFVKQMELLNQNSSSEDKQSTDAQVAYKQLLSTANQAILNMLANNS